MSSKMTCWVRLHDKSKSSNCCFSLLLLSSHGILKSPSKRSFPSVIDSPSIKSANSVKNRYCCKLGKITLYEHMFTTSLKLTKYHIEVSYERIYLTNLHDAMDGVSNHQVWPLVGVTPLTCWISPNVSSRVGRLIRSLSFTELIWK